MNNYFTEVKRNRCESYQDITDEFISSYQIDFMLSEPYKFFVKINKIITELMCNTKKVMKMKADILKIKVKKGYNQIFKQYCKENKIYYKSYPEPIINTYMAECSRDKLFSIYCYISTIENIPMVTMC